jgi:hypothetical protein
MNLFPRRSLKHDQSPQLDQPSSFDILDYCYAILLGTFDFLRWLTLKDCLHTCLQLNNSICQIIDLFVKHNYGTMNVEITDKKSCRKNPSFYFVVWILFSFILSFTCFFHSYIQSNGQMT